MPISFMSFWARKHLSSYLIKLFIALVHYSFTNCITCSQLTLFTIATSLVVPFVLCHMYIRPWNFECQVFNLNMQIKNITNIVHHGIEGSKLKVIIFLFRVCIHVIQITHDAFDCGHKSTYKSVPTLGHLWQTLH
jgi:hypothetical protein